MRLPILASVTAGLMAACSMAPTVPSSVARLMAEAPEGQPARLLLSGDRVVSAAVALGRGSLPRPVRTTIDAVAPQGEVTFRGREWSRRGEGFRIEKLYVIDGVEHRRTALIAADGVVLERAHSVPVGEIPKPILLAALEVGVKLQVALIVSGPRARSSGSARSVIASGAPTSRASASAASCSRFGAAWTRESMSDSGG